jgi:hypothetical protein
MFVVLPHNIYFHSFTFLETKMNTLRDRKIALGAIQPNAYFSDQHNRA